MKKIILFFILLLPYFGVNADYTLYVGNGCPHCAKVEAYLEENNLYEEENITTKEIYENTQNREELLDIGTQLGLSESDLGIPFLYSNNSFLIGDGDIIDYFSGENIEMISGNEIESTSKEEIKTEKSFFQFLLILLPAAISDSINPCVFAIMIVLLGSILAKTKSTSQMVKVGLAFSLSIFVAYFLMGLGILKLLSVSSEIFYIKLFAGILGLLVGLANLKDYFFYGKGFVAEIPLAWRPKLNKILKNIQSPIGAFLMGFVISLFLLPCSSGPYFTVLSYLGAESIDTRLIGIIYLIIYNLFFVLPLVIIILLVALGRKSIAELLEYKDTYKYEIHLAVGLFMIALAGYIFYDLFL